MKASRHTTPITMAFFFFFGLTGCVEDSDGPGREVETYDSSESDLASDTEQGLDSASNGENETDTERSMMVARMATFASTSSTGAIPNVYAYEEGVNGFVSIGNRRINDEYRDSSADAQFFDLIRTYSAEQWVEYIVEAHGIDECSLGIFLQVTEGDAGAFEIDRLNAGEMSLLIDGTEYAMDWAYINESTQSVRYFMYDFPEDIDGFVSGEIGVVAAGDETPPFENGIITATMPEAFALLQPENNAIIKKGPLTVEWSGGAENDVVLLTLRVFRKTNFQEWGYQAEDIHEVRCTVTDDGDFAIPAMIMDQLPANYTAMLELTRLNIEHHDVTDEFVVKTVLSQLVRIDLQVPENLID